MKKRGRKKQDLIYIRCRMGHEPILALPTPSPLMCPHIPARSEARGWEDVRRRWWDIPQGQVVLETQRVLCHRLSPAEIGKTRGEVIWLLAVRFPV